MKVKELAAVVQDETQIVVINAQGWVAERVHGRWRGTNILSKNIESCTVETGFAPDTLQVYIK